MFAWLEQSAFADTIRTAPFLYPTLETLHLLGIALLIGSVVVVDLRLLGRGRDAVAVTTVLRYLLPVSHLGFFMAAVTGAAMFSGIAVSVAASAAAPWKFGLMSLAGVNILLFHRRTLLNVVQWDLHAMPPPAARCAAAASLAAWLGVLTAGRFLAYV